MCCWTFESWGKAWNSSGESAVSTTIQYWKPLSRPVTHSWTSCRRTPKQQRYPTLSSPPNLKGKKTWKIHGEQTSAQSSLTFNTQPIITPNSTVFTYITSTLSLSSFPILGSLQQCGELLWRECQDDSTLRVLPRVCALHQGLQGEDAKQTQQLCIFSRFCTDKVPLSLLVRREVPWFQMCMLSMSVRAEQGRALAASVPQDVAYRPRPNNRKGQLGPTLELQLWCLDWFFPPPSLLPFTPGQPRPAPPHSTLPEIVLSLDLWDLLKEMFITGISAYVCVCMCNLKQ